jgi:hypothetical protein
MLLPPVCPLTKHQLPTMVHPFHYKPTTHSDADVVTVIGVAHEEHVVALAIVTDVVTTLIHPETS